jgi:hypothetical protein
MLDSHRQTPDAASVIAARQLAEEARLRRPPAALRRRRRPMTIPPLPEDAGRTE